MLKTNFFKIGISHVVVFGVFVFSYFLFQNADDGKVYLKIEDFSNQVCKYYDDNDKIPVNLTCGDYYGSCTDGNYSFMFEWCDGGGWKGTYSLISEKANKAGLFTKPVNGRSRWYILEITKRGNSVFKTDVKSIDTILVNDGVDFHLKATFYPNIVIAESKLKRSS